MCCKDCTPRASGRERGRRRFTIAVSTYLQNIDPQRNSRSPRTAADSATLQRRLTSPTSSRSNTASQRRHEEVARRAYAETRGELNNYGRALLALAMHHEKKTDEAGRRSCATCCSSSSATTRNETAWVRTPQTHWWFWWNNDIETNAWALKALATLDPQNDLAPRLVKWLLNNRRNGHYWRSTRDTALVIAAMTDYMRATGRGRARLHADRRRSTASPRRKCSVTKGELLHLRQPRPLHGLQIKPGPHKITLTKTGAGRPLLLRATSATSRRRRT